VPLSTLGVRAVVTVLLIDRVRGQSTRETRWCRRSELAQPNGQQQDLAGYLEARVLPLARASPFRSARPTLHAEKTAFVRGARGGDGYRSTAVPTVVSRISEGLRELTALSRNRDESQSAECPAVESQRCSTDP
jgi:hypothetical protein